MAKFIPTKCQTCGNDMVLMQPAIKKDHTKSVAKGEYLNCGEKYEYTVLFNPEQNAPTGERTQSKLNS